MDRNQATKIWKSLTHSNILKKYSGQIINDGTTVPTNFHKWVDGNKQTIGIVKLTHPEISETLYFVVLHWSKDRRYYLLIFPENKSTPLIEIWKYETDNNGIDNLHWQYSPSKRDGKNPERKKYFEEDFGTTDVIIDLPESREESEKVCRFINELFEIAATRSRADSLDQSASVSQKPFTELSKRRNSEEAAKLVFEQFYPNLDERRTCATLLADSIVYADTLSRVAWEVTLRQNNVIRLNVGTIEILALSPEKMYMVLAGELLNEIERQKFSNMLKFSDSTYISVPGEKGYGSIPSSELSSVLDELKPACFRLIENAVQTVVKRSPFYQSHSPGILKYLRNFLQRELPDPDYGDISVPDSGEVQEESEIVQNPEYTLGQCSDKTGFELPMLEKWVRAIERKRQAIFYGPPGTGKTYIAEQLAKHLIGGGDGFIEIVQFHPAYAYEDFIQGIRPKALDNGGLDYPTIPGRFLEFCREAQTRNDRCVLIIDEINRANLARVFGELMYLLEYRDRKVPLAGGNTLSIPENVRIIGTMNTADRSIALVDYALRRRFAFLALRPGYNVLRHYHENKQTGFAVDGLIKVLKQLNRQIGDQHYEVGISFFLHENLSEVIEDIWRMEIEPYLEEFFFDQPAKVEEFRWEKKKEEILS